MRLSVKNSAEVQNFLFDNDFEWSSGAREVQFLEQKFLIIHAKEKYFCYGEKAFTDEISFEELKKTLETSMVSREAFKNVLESAIKMLTQNISDSEAKERNPAVVNTLKQKKDEFIQAGMNAWTFWLD